MKTLLLMRHGKSDWNADFASDHERPLNKRGQAAARQMGTFLHEVGQVPDRVVTSTAVRARTTVLLASEAGAWDVPIDETRDLYLPSAHTVLRVVRDEPDTTQRLLIAGHQPTWGEATALFIGGGRITFPTAAIARVDFDVDRWHDVDFGEGDLIWFVVPKHLPDG